MEQEMGNGAYTYLEAGDLKIDRRIPVSYTHLDVYKRQIRY